MPALLAMNIAVFLDDVTAYNGPLLLIAYNRQDEVLAAGHDLETISYPLWPCTRETVRCLADAGGIVAPIGKGGGVLMFHCNIVHANLPNISPSLRPTDRLPRILPYRQLHP